MKMYLKFSIAAALLAAIAAVVVAKVQRKTSTSQLAPGANGTALSESGATVAGLPRLVDLGARSCIPCKKMAPILEQLRAEYAGRMRVDFIDVWQDRAAGEKYGVRTIPTQIFYDASGRELARHVGFMSREDILSRWAELGVSLESSPAPVEARAP